MCLESQRSSWYMKGLAEAPSQAPRVEKALTKTRTTLRVCPISPGGGRGRAENPPSWPSPSLPPRWLAVTHHRQTQACITGSKGDCSLFYCLFACVSMSHWLQQGLVVWLGTSEASVVDGHVAHLLSGEGAGRVCGSHLDYPTPCQ